LQALQANVTCFCPLPLQDRHLVSEELHSVVKSGRDSFSMATGGTEVGTAEDQQIASAAVTGGKEVDTAEGAPTSYRGVRDRDGGYGAEIRVNGKKWKGDQGKIWLGTCRKPTYAQPDVEVGEICQPLSPTKPPCSLVYIWM
jgi:hypothetical protein